MGKYNLSSVFCLILLFTALCLAQKPKKQDKAPTTSKDAGAAPPPSDAGDVDPAEEYKAQFSDFTTFQSSKYKLGSKLLPFYEAFAACKALNPKSENETKSGPHWEVFSFESGDPKGERNHIAEKAREKDLECVWLNSNVRTVGGNKVLVTNSGIEKKVELYEPTKYGASSNSTSAQKPADGKKGPPTKKTKRQVLKNGIKLITLSTVETLFPFVETLKNETVDDCMPMCQPKKCFIERSQDDCQITPTNCQVDAGPKCQILRKENEKACTGGCDNCTVDSVHCYVRTQKCIAFRQDCKIESPNCTMTKEKCSISRPPCVSYSKPCTAKPGKKSECAAEGICRNGTNSHCGEIVDPDCLAANGNNPASCSKMWNCTLDPICIKPILCRPDPISCPPVNTFCPPPTIKCPAPKVTCSRPKLTCPEPRIDCPPPDIVCSKPKVACAAPVIKCTQVVATCGNPAITCPPPAVECKNPRVTCPDEGIECPKPNDEEAKVFRLCQAEKCEGDCFCTRLVKGNQYGIDTCSCQEKCFPLCEAQG